MKVTTVPLLLTLALNDVTAKRSYVQRIPNGANVPGVEALGHSDRTGDSSSRNAFGRDFDQAGLMWTTALCQADSDGDGQTNGQELGDPCCKWKPGAEPTFTTGVSHPSDRSSKADPERWANVQCSSGAGTPSPSPTSSLTPSTDAPVNSSLSPAAETPSSSPSSASTGTASQATEPTTTSQVTIAVGLAVGVVTGVLALGGL